MNALRDRVLYYGSAALCALGICFLAFVIVGSLYALVTQ